MSSTSRAPRRVGLAFLFAFAMLWAAVWLLARSRSEVSGVARDLGEENRRFAERLRDSEDRVRELARRAREAESAAGASDAERANAEAERAAARRELFLTHFAAAERALRGGRLAEVERRLAAIPEEHAGWEQAHLRLRLALAVRRVEAHDDEALALARSADGRRLASGSISGEVRVWSAALDELVAQLDAEEEVTALALDAAGEVVAASNADGALIAWSVATGEELARWSGEDEPLALAVLPGGASAVVGFEDGAVGYWPFGAEPRWLDGHDDDVTCVAVSANGERLATGSDDETARIFGGADFGEVRVLEGHTDWVRCAAFDPAGERLATGSDDGTVRLWNAGTGAELEVVEAGEGDGDTVVSVEAGAGSDLAFVTSLGQGALQRGREVQRFELPLARFEYVTAAVLVAGEGRVVFATGDGTLRAWEREPAVPFARLDTADSAVRALAATVDVVVAGCFEGTVHVFDAVTGERRHELDGLQGGVLSVAVTPDGRVAASGGRNGTTCLWDLATGELLRELESTARVASIALNEDASRVLCVGRDGSAELWDATSGTRLSESPGPRGIVFAAVAASAADRFAWVGDAGTLRVWDAASGERLAALRDRGMGRVDALALSVDAARAAVVQGGYRAAVFDLAAGVGLGRMVQSGRSMRVLAFDPSGERLVTGGFRGALAVWDCSSGAKLIELSGGTDTIQAVAFAPDGSRILVGTAAGAVQVWESRAEALALLDR